MRTFTEEEAKGMFTGCTEDSCKASDCIHWEWHRSPSIVETEKEHEKEQGGKVENIPPARGYCIYGRAGL